MNKIVLSNMIFFVVIEYFGFYTAQKLHKYIIFAIGKNNL